MVQAIFVPVTPTLKNWRCADAETGKSRRLSPRVAFPLSVRADYIRFAKTTSPTSGTGTPSDTFESTFADLLRDLRTQADC